jgi:hypothetical protein
MALQRPAVKDVASTPELQEGNFQGRENAYQPDIALVLTPTKNLICCSKGRRLKSRESLMSCAHYLGLAALARAVPLQNALPRHHTPCSPV